jgi:hypothetical protein
MRAGFVYVMINLTMPGLVKLGATARTSRDRARKLRGTGVPDEFVVVYDELVTDHAKVEGRLHERFREHRLRSDREFFRMPIREAVRGLIEESAGFVVPRIGSNGGVEILPDLKKKYPHYVRPDFYSVKIVHRDDVVYLESARYLHANLRDEFVERTDLAFIADEDHGMFLPSRQPEDNARLFVHELDEFSMIQCTDLFTDEACQQIARKRQHG